MLVTLDGMVIEARDEQSIKAKLPMLVTPDGMVMEVRDEQPSKALLPRLLTVYKIPS